MSAAKKWVDPFEDMSDADFDTHVDELFASRPSAVAVSFRLAPDLLSRVKREAARAGVPYQTFMKGILEAGVSRLERRTAVTKRPARRVTQHR